MKNFGLMMSKLVDEPTQLGRLLDDRSIEISAVDYLTEDVVLVSYIKKEEWVEENEESNVVLSMWTTSCARFHLYMLMDEVMSAPGCKLLYTDVIFSIFFTRNFIIQTDSIIYVHPVDNNPLQTGLHLGELTGFAKMFAL